MKATGNGATQQCVENLLSIIRGENPMERVKGIDTRFVDKIQDDAKEDIKEDVKWLLKTYEPRTSIENVEITVEEQENGQYHIAAIMIDS